MRIAVLSDIHDNVWKLAAALDAVRDTTDAMLCCGDLCSPFIVHQIGRGYPRPVHVVFGNNDADLFRITSIAAKYPQVRLHGEMFTGEFDGKKFAMNHFDAIARPMAGSGMYDVVCFGHNHTQEIARVGQTLTINPGAILGMAFHADGTQREVPSTYVVYCTESGEAESFEVPAIPLATCARYMVVEHFKNGDAAAVYRRFRDRGRMAPEGLRYVSSWVDERMERCYQIMETHDRGLLEEWIANWRDLVDFEVYPVISSQEASEKIRPLL